MQVRGSALYQSDDDEVDDGVGSMSREERLAAGRPVSAKPDLKNTCGSNEMNLCLESFDDIDTLMSRLYLKANPNDIKQMGKKPASS